MRSQTLINTLYEKASNGGGIPAEDTHALITAIEETPWEAFVFSGKLRERRFYNRVDACSIVNAKSGDCSEDCAFCAQSAHHDTDAETYPLLPDEKILDCARKARDKGVRRFCIVTSGKAVYTGSEIDAIARCISRIREMGIMPCATLGSLSRDRMRTLRDAGLNRLHHNVETSRSFFPHICTTHGYDERIETVMHARELGLSTCSGGIIGMGESMTDRAEMALALREMDVDSVPLNFLVPINGTPLAGTARMRPIDALRTIALFRFMLPGKEIRVCGGRVEGLGELHPLIFLAGANGVLTGDYLTTTGRGYDSDLGMLADLGLELSYE